MVLFTLNLSTPGPCIYNCDSSAIQFDNTSMLEALSDDSSSQQEALLANLAPVEAHPQKSRPINHLLKQKIERELAFKNSQQKTRKGTRTHSSSRSRSRQQLFIPARRDYQEDARGGGTSTLKLEEGEGARRRSIIEISDDEESKMCEDYQERELRGWKEWKMSRVDELNWKERRKIDRLMERGLRYFREGKPRDQLSCKIFNTIEDYFR